PKHKEALNGLGQTYMNLREFDKAEEYFRKAVKVDGTYSDAYKNLCFALYNMGRFEEAVESCKRALENPVYRSPEKAYYNQQLRNFFALSAKDVAAVQDMVKKYIAKAIRKKR
ncbi:hypothetical protein LCGC14_2909540, partial [marine sediment metagenome]